MYGGFVFICQLGNYAEEILFQVVARYQQIDNTAKIEEGRARGYDYRAEALLLDDVVRHPDTAARSRARRLELDDERAEQAIRYYGLNIPERRKEVLAACEEYLRLVEARLKDADDSAAKEALHVFTSRMGNRLRYRSRGVYFLALAMFLCYRQYRNYFPRRQDWVKNLVPSDAKNFFPRSRLRNR